MDFLTSIQNLFHGIKIRDLCKKPAIELYNRVLSHRQVPYKHRLKGLLTLAKLQQLLCGEATMNDAAIIELAESID